MGNIKHWLNSSWVVAATALAMQACSAAATNEDAGEASGALQTVDRYRCNFPPATAAWVRFSDDKDMTQEVKEVFADVIVTYGNKYGVAGEEPGSITRTSTLVKFGHTEEALQKAEFWSAPRSERIANYADTEECPLIGDDHFIRLAEKETVADADFRSIVITVESGPPYVDERGKAWPRDRPGSAVLGYGSGADQEGFCTKL